MDLHITIHSHVQCFHIFTFYVAYYWLNHHNSEGDFVLTVCVIIYDGTVSLQDCQTVKLFITHFPDGVSMVRSSTS